MHLVCLKLSLHRIEAFPRSSVRMGHAVLRVLGFLSLILYCEPVQDALLTIEPNWSTLFTGESVTFMCDMREGNDNDWYYMIKRDDQTFLSWTEHKNYTSPLTTGHSGEYHCVGDPKSPYRNFKKESNRVSLTISDKDVILQTPASTLFRGESVTLRCRHRDQRKEEATFYKDGSLIETDINQQNTFEVTTSPTSTESSYSCKFEDEESESVKLKMQPRPKARLNKGSERDNVTLTCSVEPSSSASSSASSSGWKYFWYRGDISSEPLTTQDYILLSNGQIRVSQRGLYWCRGGRGNPVFYTEYSEGISVKIRAVVTLQPNWPELYSGETITLVCLVEDVGDTEWEYGWSTPNSYRPQNPRDHMIRSSLSGVYRCWGRSKKYKIYTESSDAFTLKLDSNKPKPDLTVSPAWLSPGASVTLNCSVQHLSAGWRFYWYKAVPKLSESSYNSYSYELLPGSTNGTEPYIVHGQTHTAGYMCRAERGDPVYSTHYSATTFIWSGDFNPAASLSVSPDRVQHFREESPSLSCEGNSTEWRVSRFSLYGSPLYCSTWGTMTGSTCIMNQTRISGVYWCESGTGQFSNAVNITIHYNDVILVSPALPVVEGRPVTLGCKSKTDEALSDVEFYKNGKFLPNQSRGELAISAVSKSDEGLYRCEALTRWHQKSPDSWMSVKFHSDVSVPGSEQSSPLPVVLITGLVCGVLMIMILLLGLYHCRKSKYSSFMSRSQSTNQGPAADDITNQVETRHKDYPSPLHGDAVLFESISVSEEPKHDESIDVTYSVVELKKLTRKGKNNKPEESTVYSSVAMASAADDNLMYAEVHAHTEAKKDKGKSSPAAADQTVYSELKPKTAPR